MNRGSFQFLRYEHFRVTFLIKCQNLRKLLVFLVRVFRLFRFFLSALAGVLLFLVIHSRLRLFASSLLLVLLQLVFQLFLLSFIKFDHILHHGELVSQSFDLFFFSLFYSFKDAVNDADQAPATEKEKKNREGLQFGTLFIPDERGDSNVEDLLKRLMRWGKENRASGDVL